MYSKEVSANCPSDRVFIGYDIITLFGVTHLPLSCHVLLALGLGPRQGVVTEIPSPKTISKHSLELVAGPVPHGMDEEA